VGAGAALTDIGNFQKGSNISPATAFTNYAYGGLNLKAVFKAHKK
jgi:hypothetical protein